MVAGPAEIWLLGPAGQTQLPAGPVLRGELGSVFFPDTRVLLPVETLPLAPQAQVSIAGTPAAGGFYGPLCCFFSVLIPPPFGVASPAYIVSEPVLVRDNQVETARTVRGSTVVPQSVEWAI